MSRRRTDQREWTTGEIARLHSAFLTGRQLKLIAEDLDRTVDSVRSQIENRRKQDPEGWPVRRNTKTRNERITVEMPTATARIARRRAHIRGSTLSRYIRILIERDA